MNINDLNICRKCKQKFALSRTACPKCGTSILPPDINTPTSENKELVHCKTCDRLLSKNARKCPGCGQTRITPSNVALLIIIVSTLIIYKVSFYLSDKRAEKVVAQQAIIKQQKRDEQEKKAVINKEKTHKEYEKKLQKQQEADELKQLFQKAHNKIIENTTLKTSWWRSGFGNILEATFIITNNNDVALKDINITCGLYAQSDTKLSEIKHTLYNHFPAKHIVTIKDVNLGFINEQTHKVGCYIADADY